MLEMDEYTEGNRDALSSATFIYESSVVFPDIEKILTFCDRYREIFKEF